MDSRERDAALWDYILAPAVVNLGTEKALYDTLRKAFDHLTPEQRDALETALSEHEIALGLVCYNIGIAQGVGVKEQLAPVAT